LHAANAGPPGTAVDTNPLAGWTAYFEKIYDGQKCDTPSLSRGKVEAGGLGFDKCRERCSQNERCMFFAYSKQTRFCETYSKCDRRLQDERSQIWGRLSECELELQQTGSDSSINGMVDQIPPPGIINWETSLYNDRLPNIVCSCTTLNTLFCVIFVAPGSPQDMAVKAKFTKHDARNLAPFYVPNAAFIDMNILPVCCDLISALTHQPMSVEIEVVEMSRCIDRAICAGVHSKFAEESQCPVMNTLFDSPEMVYIIKGDAEKVRRGEHVPCITVNGMRSITTHQGIQDPFGREPKGPGVGLVERLDYDLYILWHQDHLKMGVCGDDYILAKGSGASSSNEAGPSSDRASPTKKKKANKKKKGKKKSGLSISASSSASPFSPQDGDEDEEDTEESELSPLKQTANISPKSASPDPEAWNRPPTPISPNHPPTVVKRRPEDFYMVPPKTPSPDSDGWQRPPTPQSPPEIRDLSQASISPPKSPSPDPPSVPRGLEHLSSVDVLSPTPKVWLTPQQRARRKFLRMQRPIPEAFLPSSHSNSDEERLEQSVHASQVASSLWNKYMYLILVFMFFAYFTSRREKNSGGQNVYVEFEDSQIESLDEIAI